MAVIAAVSPWMTMVAPKRSLTPTVAGRIRDSSIHALPLQRNEWTLPSWSSPHSEPARRVSPSMARCWP